MEEIEFLREIDVKSRNFLHKLLGILLISAYGRKSNVFLRVCKGSSEILHEIFGLWAQIKSISWIIDLCQFVMSCPTSVNIACPTSVNNALIFKTSLALTLLNSLSRFKANNQILWTTYFCLKNICMLLLFFCTFVHDFWIFWRFTYIRRIDWTGPWQSQQPDESPWKLKLNILKL